MLESVFSEIPSFATGRHPTTELCRQFIEEQASFLRLDELVDIGTGDGSLAILAARLGAKRVIAIDRDATQLALAEAAAARAGISNIEFRALPASRLQARSRLVVANLWVDDLLESAGDLSRVTAASGALFCTGMRLWQAHRVRSALEAVGFQSFRVRASLGWGGLHLRKLPEV
jgi:ribosomal protein L11 methyltransferase